MKEILLSQGCIALVDDEDYEMLSQYKWYIKFGKKYAEASVWIKEQGKVKHILMHRLIMGIVSAPRSVEVDHIDGNGLNNQKANMRVCDRIRNSRNTRTHNKTGYRGVNVIRDKWGEWYAAKISVDKKPIYLGCFKTPLEAAVAYNQAAIKYHGEFASLNEIPHV